MASYPAIFENQEGFRLDGIVRDSPYEEFILINRAGRARVKNNNKCIKECEYHFPDGLLSKSDYIIAWHL